MASKCPTALCYAILKDVKDALVKRGERLTVELPQTTSGRPHTGGKSLTDEADPSPNSTPCVLRAEGAGTGSACLACQTPERQEEPIRQEEEQARVAPAVGIPDAGKQKETLE